MAFHRLTVPSYTGGLPGGYDYINNAVVGTPAPADGALSGGTYSGSYFFPMSGQVTGSSLNRAAKALAENCDYLDDLFRRDLAVPTRSDFSAGGSPVSTVQLTGPGIYIGKPGTPNTVAGINTFVQLTDQDDNEILNAGVECKVTAISDTVGNNFSAGNVDLTISPAIPAGIAYRVYHGVRGNLAGLPVDALTSIKVRGAEEVPGELLASGGATLIGYSPSGSWADATGLSASNVGAALNEILADLGASTGDIKIGSPARAASWMFGLASGSAGVQLAAIQAYLDLGPNGRRVHGLSANTTLSASTHRQIKADTSGGAFTLTLPAPAHGIEFFVKDPNGSWATNNLTLARNGSEKIDNVASDRVFAAGFGAFRVWSDGTDWFLD